MGRSKAPSWQDRGVAERGRSGSKGLRRVDPLSGRGRRVCLSETIPAGPKAAAAEAEQAKTRLLNQVDEQRNPRTRATVNQLMDRYLELLDVDTNTRRGYEGYIRNHVRPLLGTLPVGRLDGETLDSFYAVLRTCHAHCGGRQYIEHRSAEPHTCNSKCTPYARCPLAASSIRQIHWCLRGALQRAVRWRWIGVNPIDQATTPRRPDQTRTHQPRNRPRASSARHSTTCHGECSCGSP